MFKRKTRHSFFLLSIRIREIMFGIILALFFITGCADSEAHLRDECSRSQFPCYDGSCISKLNWCDGEIDCENGYDELLCLETRSYEVPDPNKCADNPKFFMCRNGRCIPDSGRCDGYRSCTDYSDEESCKTNPESLSENYEISLLESEDTKRTPLYTGESSNFIGLDYDDYRKNLDQARDWLLSQQSEDFGWDDYTARAVIAMYLSKKNNFKKDENEMLMNKQLDIQLSIALTRNQTKEMSLSELSLYINALTVSCKNPRNFYGYDLVNTLRERVNYAQNKHVFVNPYVHLTLCINNLTHFGDLNILQNIIRRRSTANKIDLLALAVLAASCITKLPEYPHDQLQRNIVEILLIKLKSDGLPKNVYELSLVIQALNMAKVDPDQFDMDEAMTLILNEQNKTSGSYGDILGTYYAISLLSGRSPLSLSAHCNQNFSNGLTPLAVLRNSKKAKVSVLYSLFYGHSREMSQKIQLQVSKGTNFLDVMRLAQDENPNFRFKLDNTKTVPFVYSIGGLPNDAERGLYWTLHISSPYNKTDYIPFNNDIRDHIPRNGEETVFWLKPI